MIQILPLKDKKILDSLNQKEGTNATLAYCLYEGNTGDAPQGYILYNINAERIEVVKINSNDDMYVDGLIKSAFASAYDIGINKAIFANSCEKAVVRKLGIIKPNENNVDSIKEIIYHCAGCKKQDDCRGCSGNA